MAASSNLIADIGVVITNGPGAATIAAAIVATGPIMDYIGNCKLLELKFKEADVAVNLIHGVTDGSDTNLTNIHKLMAIMDGAGGPSTTVLTDCAAVVARAPTAPTKALAIRAAGPIMDYEGMVKGLYLKYQECYNLAYALRAITDAGDTANKAKLADILTALS